MPIKSIDRRPQIRKRIGHDGMKRIDDVANYIPICRQRSLAGYGSTPRVDEHNTL